PPLDPPRARRSRAGRDHPRAPREGADLAPTTRPRRPLPRGLRRGRRTSSSAPHALAPHADAPAEIGIARELEDHVVAARPVEAAARLLEGADRARVAADEEIAGED